jgi:L-ascorbate metabolism protein UlaG (beta-lactamase superfamily)
LVTAAAAYRIAPHFWNRFSEDIKRTVEPATLRPHIRNWPSSGLHAAWIGHSTVFLSLDGFTILTDPVFGSRVGINFGPVTLGLKRLIDPAVPLQEIPRPDLVLLSHAHMDHFDLPSLRRLENQGTTVITAASTSDLLRAHRYGAVHELKWNERVQVGAANVQAIRVNHWGARMQSDTHRGYNGYLIDTGKRRVLFGGDTAYTDAFRQLRSAKPINLAIMPIGAYDPWIRMHCNPEQALEMADHAGAECVLGVHHQTFRLSSEPRGEPMERLVQAAGSAEDRIVVREIGGELHLS